MVRRCALMPHRVMEVLNLVSRRRLSPILITVRRRRGGHVATVIHKIGSVAILDSERPRLK